MPKLSLDLSDDLGRLADNLDGLTRDGLSLDREATAILAATLRSLYRAARALETEVSRHRWNEAARLERADIGRILDAATRPGSNVKLFPVIHRPIPGGIPAGLA